MSDPRCMLCLEVFTPHGDRMPRLLRCGHSMCTSCSAYELAQGLDFYSGRVGLQKGDCGEIACPCCGSTTAVSDGVRSLSPNYALVGFLDSGKQVAKHLHLAHKDSPRRRRLKDTPAFIHLEPPELISSKCVAHTHSAELVWTPRAPSLLSAPPSLTWNMDGLSPSPPQLEHKADPLPNGPAAAGGHEVVTHDRSVGLPYQVEYEVQARHPSAMLWVRAVVTSLTSARVVFLESGCAYCFRVRVRCRLTPDHPWSYWGHGGNPLSLPTLVSLCGLTDCADHNVAKVLQSQGIADEARNHKSGIASWGLEQIIKAVPEAEELVRAATEAGPWYLPPAEQAAGKPLKPQVSAAGPEVDRSEGNTAQGPSSDGTEEGAAVERKASPTPVGHQEGEDGEDEDEDDDEPPPLETADSPLMEAKPAPSLESDVDSPPLSIAADVGVSDGSLAAAPPTTRSLQGVANSPIPLPRIHNMPKFEPSFLRPASLTRLKQDPADDTTASSSADNASDPVADRAGAGARAVPDQSGDEPPPWEIHVFCIQSLMGGPPPQWPSTPSRRFQIGVGRHPPVLLGTGSEPLFKGLPSTSVAPEEGSKELLELQLRVPLKPYTGEERPPYMHIMQLDRSLTALSEPVVKEIEACFGIPRERQQWFSVHERRNRKFGVRHGHHLEKSWLRERSFFSLGWRAVFVGDYPEWWAEMWAPSLSLERLPYSIHGPSYVANLKNAPRDLPEVKSSGMLRSGKGDLGQRWCDPGPAIGIDGGAGAGVAAGASAGASGVAASSQGGSGNGTDGGQDKEDGKGDGSGSSDSPGDSKEDEDTSSSVPVLIKVFDVEQQVTVCLGLQAIDLTTTIQEIIDEVNDLRIRGPSAEHPEAPQWVRSLPVVTEAWLDEHLKHSHRSAVRLSNNTNLINLRIATGKSIILQQSFHTTSHAAVLNTVRRRLLLSRRELLPLRAGDNPLKPNRAYEEPAHAGAVKKKKKKKKRHASKKGSSAAETPAGPDAAAVGETAEVQREGQGAAAAASEETHAETEGEEDDGADREREGQPEGDKRRNEAVDGPKETTSFKPLPFSTISLPAGARPSVMELNGLEASLWDMSSASHRMDVSQGDICLQNLINEIRNCLDQPARVDYLIRSYTMVVNTYLGWGPPAPSKALADSSSESTPAPSASATQDGNKVDGSDKMGSLSLVKSDQQDKRDLTLPLVLRRGQPLGGRHREKRPTANCIHIASRSPGDLPSNDEDGQKDEFDVPGIRALQSTFRGSSNTHADALDGGDGDQKDSNWPCHPSDRPRPCIMDDSQVLNMINLESVFGGENISGDMGGTSTTWLPPAGCTDGLPTSAFRVFPSRLDQAATKTTQDADATGGESKGRALVVRSDLGGQRPNSVEVPLACLQTVARGYREYTITLDERCRIHVAKCNGICKCVTVEA